MDKVTEYIDRVKAGVKETLSINLKDLEHSCRLTQFQCDIVGMSSAYNRTLISCLVVPGDRYLEIGVLKGSMFIPAVQGKGCYAVAIDNFSQFDTGNLQEFPANCLKANIDFTFIVNDCFNLLPEAQASISNMNVYFYDGSHTEEDQRKALTYYKDMLADVFIYVVDDWNHEPARLGTRTGIAETGIIVRKQWEFFTTKNGDTDSWWNGLYVAVCEKPKP